MAKIIKSMKDEAKVVTSSLVQNMITTHAQETPTLKLKGTK